MEQIDQTRILEAVHINDQILNEAVSQGDQSFEETHEKLHESLGAEFDSVHYCADQRALRICMQRRRQPLVPFQRVSYTREEKKIMPWITAAWSDGFLCALGALSLTKQRIESCQLEQTRISQANRINDMVLDNERDVDGYDSKSVFIKMIESLGVDPRSVYYVAHQRTIRTCLMIRHLQGQRFDTTQPPTSFKATRREKEIGPWVTAGWIDGFLCALRANQLMKEQSDS